MADQSDDTGESRSASRAPPIKENRPDPRAFVHDEPTREGSDKDDLAEQFLDEAKSLADRGEIESAIDALDQGLRIDPDHVGLLLERAAIRAMRSDVHGAERDYDHALCVAPRSASGYVGRATVLLAQQKPLRAAADALTAESIGTADQAWNEIVAEVMDRASQSLDREGLPEGGRAILLERSHALADISDAFGARFSALVAQWIPEVAHEHLLLAGERWMAAGAPERALDAFESVLESEKKDARALMGAGRAYLALGAYADAARSLTAMMMGTSDPPIEAKEGLAEAYLALTRGRAALETLEVDLGSLTGAERARVEILRGRAYEQLGQGGAALESYNRAVEGAPTHVEAWYRRAATRARAGEAGDAIADLQRAASLVPGHELIARAEKDAAFDSLHAHPAFRALAARGAGETQSRAPSKSEAPPSRPPKPAFTLADLTKDDFTRADLTRADLTNGDFTTADLTKGVPTAHGVGSRTPAARKATLPFGESLRDTKIDLSIPGHSGDPGEEDSVEEDSVPPELDEEITATGAPSPIDASDREQPKPSDHPEGEATDEIRMPEALRLAASEERTTGSKEALDDVTPPLAIETPMLLMAPKSLDLWHHLEAPPAAERAGRASEHVDTSVERPTARLGQVVLAEVDLGEPEVLSAIGQLGWSFVAVEESGSVVPRVIRFATADNQTVLVVRDPLTETHALQIFGEHASLEIERLGAVLRVKPLDALAPAGLAGDSDRLIVAMRRLASLLETASHFARPKLVALLEHALAATDADVRLEAARVIADHGITELTKLVAQTKAAEDDDLVIFGFEILESDRARRFRDHEQADHASVALRRDVSLRNIEEILFARGYLRMAVQYPTPHEDLEVRFISSDERHLLRLVRDERAGADALIVRGPDAIAVLTTLIAALPCEPSHEAEERAFSGQTPEIRMEALEHVMAAPPRTVSSVLRRALERFVREGDVDIRLAVCECATRISDPSLVALLTALRDRDPSLTVRGRARDALYRYVEQKTIVEFPKAHAPRPPRLPDATRLVVPDDRTREAMAKAAAELGWVWRGAEPNRITWESAARDASISLLELPRFHVCFIEVTGRSKDNEALRALMHPIGLLDRASLLATAAGKGPRAARAIHQLSALIDDADDGALRVLETSLASDDDALRYAAVATTVEAHIYRLAPELARLALDEPNPGVRDLANRALERLR